MDENKIDLERTDMTELSFEYADELIEAAAATVTYNTGALTLSFCTGLDTCPA